jgi:hypothetical protein
MSDNKYYSRSPIPKGLQVKAVSVTSIEDNPFQPTESKPLVGLGIAACIGLRVLLSQEV